MTSVDLSPDGRQASVNVSVIPEKFAELTVHGLVHATGHIRSQVAAGMATRRVPKLTFRLDTSLKKQASVLAAINRGRRRDADSTREDS